MSRYLCISLALGIGCCLAAPALAADVPLGPQPGVLMLRNGQLVEGDILLAGDRYDVGVGGGQIHIKRSEVDFVGRTVLECYQHRRSRTEPTKVQEDLELAEWCLKRELYEQAALALADAIDADPLHPRIGLLERRLKFALERPAEASTAPREVQGAASIRDLDLLTESLPAGSMEMFTNAIQPVLLNHCSTSGCHGAHSESPLRLTRIPPGRTPSRRATQRNLYGAMELVDRLHPGESRLLTVPTGPHGSVRSAVFSAREANQYRQLVVWVYLAAGQGVPADVAQAVQQASSTPVRAVRKPNARSAKEARKLAESGAEPQSLGTAKSQKEAKAVAGSLRQQPGQPAVQKASAEGAAEPDDVDPFDPAEFNRRFAPPSDPD